MYSAQIAVKHYKHVDHTTNKHCTLHINGEHLARAREQKWWQVDRAPTWPAMVVSKGATTMTEGEILNPKGLTLTPVGATEMP